MNLPAAFHCRRFAPIPAMTLLVAIVTGCASTSGTTRHDDALTSANGSYIVVYTTSPCPIPLNGPFSIDVNVYDGRHPQHPATDISLHVDGRMPQHRHGMNRQPRVTVRDDGSFFVEGMLFHMPGQWVLNFDIARNGIVERAQDVVVLD